MSSIKLSKGIIDKIETLSNQCIGCKKCMKNCIMLYSYCSAPKELFSEIVRTGEVDVTIPYSCNLCNLCTEVCPSNINQKELYLELRRYAFTTHKKAIMPLGYRIVKFHQKNSFSKLFSFFMKKMENDCTAFIPGCSIMSYSPEIVMETCKYLQNIIPKIKIILKCCGNPTHTMGDQKGFKQYYSQLDHELQKLKVTEIITTCPNCFISIKENSPKLKITTLWEKINESVIQGRLLDKYVNVDIKFSLHDPCPTRLENNTHVAVREIIKKMGIKMEEFQFSKRQTLCCGAGAMLEVTNKNLAVAHMNKRAQEATTDCILTYCQTCAESLSIGDKNAIHLLDLMFNEEMFSTLSFQQKKNNTTKKWSNRYKGKRIIEKL